MANFQTGNWTQELTNGTITLDASWAVRAISVFCSTATSGTITGATTIGGYPSQALTISQNQSITFETQSDGCFVGMIITAPAGCTLQMIAQV